MKLYEFTASELKTKLDNNEISCAELCNAYIKRIEEVDSKTGAFLTQTFDKALDQAVEFDNKKAKGQPLNSLSGLCYGLKDNICTKGIRTTCSSKMLENFIPPYSAHVQDKLEQESGIMLGKLDMDEFAMGTTNQNSAFGIVRNPHNLEYIPGGSSGASAASVAASEVSFALGSDTGGSIRTPAAFCGVTGFKPTYGTVSRYGVVPMASSFDQVGTLTKDIADAALVLNSISGYDPKDSTSLSMDYPDYTSFLTEGIKGLKIGIDRSTLERGVHEDIINSYHSMIETFERLGAEIVDVSFDMLEYVIPVYYILTCSEASSNLARFDGIRYGKREDGANASEIMINSRSKNLGPEVQKRIMLGTYSLSTGYYDMYYSKALRLRRKIKDDFYRILNQCDIYMSPTTPSPAFKIGQTEKSDMEIYLSDIFTVTANLTGVPAVSIPAGFTKDSLPIGMQLHSKALREDLIIRAGYNYQLVTNHHKQLPAL